MLSWWNLRRLEVVQADGAQDALDDRVRIAVAARSAVLEVAFAVVGNATWDTDRAATVGNASVEVVDR
jgi:hypothetical protein